MRREKEYRANAKRTRDGHGHHPVHEADHHAVKWIAGAIKHPGALHRELGVPKGKKIPAKKLAKAAHSSNPKLAKRARLAETLEGFHHHRGR